MVFFYLYPMEKETTIFGIRAIIEAIKSGENIDKIADEHGLSYFFWMLTIISVIVAIFAMLMEPVVKKLMHGVR